MNNWGEVDLDKLYEQMLNSVYGPRSAQGTRGEEVVGKFVVEGSGIEGVDVGLVDERLVPEVREMVVAEGGSIKRAKGVRKTYAVRLTEEAHLGLKQVAKEFGLWWGGDGNISGLLQLIGEGKLRVVLEE